MDQELTTPRLKLTLLAHAARGSEEFAWLHELRSDKQAQHWRYTTAISYSNLTNISLPLLTIPSTHPMTPRA